MDLFVEEFDVAAHARRGPRDDRAAGGQERQHASRSVASPDLGAMRSDQIKVRQILFNLLSNAAKFTKAGPDHAGGATAGRRARRPAASSRSRTPASG